MKHPPVKIRTKAFSDRRGFTLIELMVSMFVTSLVLGLTMGTFLYCIKMMYKDNQRLATNASLRIAIAQLTKKTLDSSFFYVFPYYTSLDGSVNLATDPSPQAINATSGGYEEGNGDCLVLVTTTVKTTPVKIRQIKVYYRTTTNQAGMNADAPLRYYESADWGEGAGNTKTYATDADLEAVLNTINLNSNPSLAGSKQINARTRGRKMPTGTDLYPMFSTAQPAGTTADTSTVSINVEFVNGFALSVGGTSLLSSSSFNYTISPRR